MTHRTVLVTADWAQHGKTPNDRGYRLLNWSDGTVGRQNFEEALTRYSPGTLDDLPQVTVSYLPAQQRDLNYLAIAIHHFPEDDRYDVDGRKIVFTNYFCMPYRQLAAAAVSYQAMYETFRAIRLPADGYVQITAELPITEPRVPADDELALRVAALLLTGDPVCILDANRTNVTDRLRFIDSVMSLLPYGMRSRMSASTWTSSTYRGHRFRLFFSNAPRETDDQDRVVIWGQPERSPITRAEGHAYDYLAWLRDRVQQPVARLAEQTDEQGFRTKEVLQMLELLGITDNHPGLDYSADRQDLLHSARGPAAHPGQEPAAPDILASCADEIGSGHVRGLKSNIAWLRNYLSHAGPLVEQERKQCREVIRRHELLRPGLSVGDKLEAAFYDILLRAAFGVPLSYDAYCQLEDCLGNTPSEPPHRPLLEVIDRGCPRDPRVLSLVLWYLGGGKLSQWFRSGQLDVRQLIAMLADAWPRVHHARIACEVVLRYLGDMQGHYEPRMLLPALQDCGYLAPALQLRHPDEPQYQVNVLSGFLQAVYGGRLDRHVATDILGGGSKPPTTALLAATLLMLADKGDAGLVGREFLRGVLSFTDFDVSTQTYLARLMTGSNLVSRGRP